MVLTGTVEVITRSLAGAIVAILQSLVYLSSDQVAGGGVGEGRKVKMGSGRRGKKWEGTMSRGKENGKGR